MPNEQLRDAARAYVASAIKLLRERKALIVIGGLTEWVRVDDHFEARPRTAPRADTGSHSAELHARPEYGRLVGELTRDSAVGPQLNELVGTQMGQFRLDASRIADDLIVETVGDTGELVFAEDAFARAYARVAEALYVNEFSIVMIAPIEKLESNALPLELDDIALDVLTDDEVVACLNAGMLRPLAGMMPVVFTQGLVGLRHRFSIPKVIGPQENADSVIPLVNGLRDRTDRLLEVLRLLKNGTVTVPGFVYYSDSWILRGAISFQTLGPVFAFRFGNYSINHDEAQELRQLWQAVRDPRVVRHKSIPVALRRLSFAGERQRPDDRMVDLMVAGEALFLPADNQELSYKLATRAAFFLEDRGFGRKETFAHMKTAYTVRSKIVHGSRLPKLKAPDGTETTLEAFADKTADYLRVATKKALAISIGAEEGSLDFDSLVLR